MNLHMAGKIAVNPAEGLQVFQREETFERQCCVGDRRAVTLRNNETVPVRLVRILRIDIHGSVVENRHDVCHRERTADVTGSSSVNGLKSGFSDGCCHQLQFPFLFSLHSLSLHNRIDKQVTNGRQLHV